MYSDLENKLFDLKIKSREEILQNLPYYLKRKPMFFSIFHFEWLSFLAYECLSYSKWKTKKYMRFLYKIANFVAFPQTLNLRANHLFWKLVWLQENWMDKYIEHKRDHLFKRVWNSEIISIFCYLFLFRNESF